MAHNHNQAAEEILDKEFRVLDKGFVRLVDYLGSDQRIVQSARVSYGQGTKTIREDKGLIDYLVRNGHSSPLEQVVLTFHCKMPIFVARQWIRHRTGRPNEASGRYSILPEEFYIPDPHQVRAQSTKNKQGRDGELPETIVEKFLDKTQAIGTNAFQEYHEIIDEGVARELARINLPVSTYTEWYWQIDLRNLFHFLELRLDSHAQYEIREYAKVLADCAKTVAPYAYEAFEEHVLYGQRFSRTEMTQLRVMLSGAPCEFENERRKEEFLKKLEIL